MATVNTDHKPVGYDQDGRPFDCAACGGRWPCRLAKVMCPQCGQLSGMTRDGLVPEHPPQPGEPGRLCMGSMQNPRNPESDGRPLWNGKRKALDGPKSSLWMHFRRAVEALEPTWVLIENVETWRSWVPDVRADLSGLGYASVPLELSAGSFGAPHRRPRIFVVAHANGVSKPLLAIHEEVGKLRPLSGPDSRDWRDAPPRTVPLDDGVSAWVDNDLYGNAVVPEIAAWLGSQMLAHEFRAVA